MKKFIEEYGIIIVVICLILLMLAFSSGGLSHKVTNSIISTTEQMDAISRKRPKGTPVEMVSGMDTYSVLSMTEAEKIVFTDDAAPSTVEVTDLSAKGDKSIVGWAEGTTYKISTQDYGKSVQFSADSSYMFMNCTAKEIDFDNIDTSAVTNMTAMFYGCSNLERLDLSNFDTSSVTNMSNMFQACTSLNKITLNNWNTSKVTNMNYTFYYLKNLETLDLSSFDLTSLESNTQMFFKCNKLKKVNIKKQEYKAQFEKGEDGTSINFAC